MKRLSTYIVTIMLLFAATASGQSFSQLWKQSDEAARNDLPQSQIKVLKQITSKAEREKAYGHLLKASLLKATVQSQIDYDSLEVEVERLKKEADKTTDISLKAIYYAVLSKVYSLNTDLSESWKETSKLFLSKATEKPAVLAATKVDGYTPFVVKGSDSRVFGNDLLSLICQETGQYKVMADYYMTTTNRRAKLFSLLFSLDEPDGRESMADSKYIRQLDSLILRYGDLTECGEVAIQRYNFMNEQTDATAAQKVAFIDEALSRWGAWHRMNILREERSLLTTSQFNAILSNRVFIPNREQSILLKDLRSIDKLTLNIYRVNGDATINLDPDNEEDYKKLKPLLTQMPELTQTRSYNGRKEYELFNDSLLLQPLPVGVYMMEMTSQPQTSVSRTLFAVSNVRMLMEDLPDNRIRFVAVNATTGKPLPGAQLSLTNNRNSRKQGVTVTLTTDKNGEYIYTYNDDRPNSVFVTTADDRYCPPLNSYGRFSYYDNQRTQEHTAIYTDRAIYRPGQKVQVAAIMYQTKNGFEHEALQGKTITARLRDANYKVIDERQLTTDELGTVAADFTLPARGLTGDYSLNIGNETQFFRVEEYKRPTFHVDFPNVEQSYKDGDTLSVRATALSYAGMPVQGARVSYTVERRMAFWWLSYYRYWQGGFYGIDQQNEKIFSGEAVTGDDGTFEVQMPMVMPASLNPQFYNFVVVADVTDQAGETHQGQLSLPLGNRKTIITADLSDKILSEQMPPVKLHVLNAAGNDVATTVRYQIDGGKWMSAQSNTAIILPKLKSGKHSLTAEYEGEKLERSFVVFSLNDKRPAIETDDWFYVSDKQFSNDGTPVTLQVGSSKDVHIVYTIVAGNNIIEQGSIEKNNELANRKLTYKPEYGNGISLSFAWIRDGKVYHHIAQIQRPLPNKKLTLKWETFRDRLTPGQQEEWTVSIAAPNGEKLEKTALIAALYDKSLDQIVEHNWSLEPSTWLPMAHLRWIYGDWGGASCSGYKNIERMKWNEINFNHFDYDCFPRPWVRGGVRKMFRGMSIQNMEMADAAPTMLMKEAKQEVATGAQKLIGQIGGLDIESGDEEESSATDDANGRRLPDGQVRENLQETAFFYPQLFADSNGTVRLKFTLPESLTTWRFMGIAHTKDMKHGYLDGEAVAQKDVMIQPNVPRFLRMGDNATISARLFNTTDHEQNGTVRLMLLDSETNKCLIDEQTACSLPANGTSAVTFNIDASRLDNFGSQLLICKMTVNGETFSDGEQHYLPVLPDKELVTVTMPFSQNTPGTKSIDLSATTASANGKLTVEYTNNPAWLMIQALPSIATAYDKNAISQAASLYANKLGKYILEQNNQAKNVFEAWKRESAEHSSLTSQLEKDEELKELLLKETPWVMDADRETEQKQRLADFFDENTMQQRLEYATEQLTKLQNTDGSWSWWEGMNGSFYMTVEISEMLVRLNNMIGKNYLNGNNDSTEKILSKQLERAFSFMNKEILEMVAEMKKQEKKGIRQSFPTFKALQYLYLCTLDGRKQPANVQQAQAYLKKLLKKDISRQSIYEKAMTAIILNSPLYIKSLKEYTVYSEEMGRYYNTKRAGYSWYDYRIPTQVAVIEALQRLTPNDTKTIDEMRRWLLQEKRTQAWNTPINSVNAIYAFMNAKQSPLTSQPMATLKIDGKQLDISQATAGIGYVKTTMPMNGQKSFTAEKTSKGTSWGAVYAQFFKPTAEITNQSSGLSVKRELISDSNCKTTELKVGNRIKVRITITADRDYDFVQVTEKRAACMEPVSQLSGYRNGAYCSPRDNATYYFFDKLHKGKHVIETEYYIDRTGTYQSGTCTVSCVYAPEYHATTGSLNLNIEK